MSAERVLKDTERTRCRVGVPVVGNETIDQSALLCHARFEFCDMPPSGGFMDRLFHHPKPVTHGMN